LLGPAQHYWNKVKSLPSRIQQFGDLGAHHHTPNALLHEAGEAWRALAHRLKNPDPLAVQPDTLAQYTLERDHRVDTHF
jgi:hypothetical protein